MTDHLHGLTVLHAPLPLPSPKFEADPTDRVRALLERLRNAGVDSAVVLNTCQRFEICSEQQHTDVIVRELCAWNPTIIAESQILTGTKALEHMMRLACGLESRVLGEVEVLGQVRRAHRHSLDCGICNGLVDRVLQRAVRAGKRARSETRISQGAMGLASTVIAELHRAGCLDGTITIVGAGMIGSKVAHSIHLRHPSANLQILNRTAERSHSLANRTGATAVNWEDAQTAMLRSSAIVIAVDGAPLAVDVTTQSEPNAVVVDISMPAVAYASSPADVSRIVGLEQIETLMSGTRRTRSAEIPAVERIIREELAEVIAWVEGRSALQAEGATRCP